MKSLDFIPNEVGNRRGFWAEKWRTFAKNHSEYSENRLGMRTEAGKNGQEPTSVVWARNNGDLDQGGGRRSGAKWPDDSGSSLKTELTVCDDRCSHGERKKEMSWRWFKGLGLRKLKRKKKTKPCIFICRVEERQGKHWFSGKVLEWEPKIQCGHWEAYLWAEASRPAPSPQDPPQRPPAPMAHRACALHRLLIWAAGNFLCSKELARLCVGCPEGLWLSTPRSILRHLKNRVCLHTTHPACFSGTSPRCVYTVTQSRPQEGGFPCAHRDHLLTDAYVTDSCPSLPYFPNL